MRNPMEDWGIGVLKQRAEKQGNGVMEFWSNGKTIAHYRLPSRQYSNAPVLRSP